MATHPQPIFPGQLRVYRDPEQVAAAAAELFVDTAAESISARERFRVVLSGGSTPRRAYQLLATEPFARRVDWEKVEFFWGDERYVPAADPDSNYRLAAETLLQRVPAPSFNIHRVPTEVSPPSAAAFAYESSIRQSFGEAQSTPHFDLIFLGLGTNGHTASLFPHSPALQETSHLVLADFVSEVNAWRITMTAPLLNRGRTVAFLINGQKKADVFREVVLGPRDPQHLPAQLIAPQGHLLWLADQPAASRLR